MNIETRKVNQGVIGHINKTQSPSSLTATNYSPQNSHRLMNESKFLVPSQNQILKRRGVQISDSPTISEGRSPIKQKEIGIIV